MDERTFREQCRRRRIKLTEQRLAVYKALSASKDHPSTDAVYRKIKSRYPRISFDTVNRTLLTLLDMGLARLVEGSGGGRCFDPILEPHHHLHCMKCHAIIDFHSETYDRLRLPKKLPGNFEVLGKRVVLEGLCKKCKPSKGETR
jgi:Fur family peroxide stress response transcriptional regulator